jgi:hypothetical protein
VTAYTPYRLLDAERHKAETDTVPDEVDYTPKELEKRVRKRVNLLPNRFEALFNDIELLSENGYLDAGLWGDNWCDLLDTGRPTSNEKSPAVTFGRRLGSMASRVVRQSSNIERGDVLTDLAWGFMQGIGPQSPGGLTNNRFTDECAEKIGERANNATALYVQGVENITRRNSQESENVTTENELLREFLEVQEIEPKDWLIGAVRDDIKRENGIKDVRATPLSETVDSVEDAIAREHVQRIVNENDLLKKQRLLDSIEWSREQVENIERDGISATEVLLNVPPKDTVTTREISEQVDTENLPHVPVITLGEYLSNNHEIDGEGWDRPEVFDIDPNADNYTRQEWNLRPYGQILKHHIQTRAEFPELPHPTLRESRPLRDLPEDIIEAALDDLDSPEECQRNGG